MGLDETGREAAYSDAKTHLGQESCIGFAEVRLQHPLLRLFCAVRDGEENCRLVAQAPTKRIGSATERETLRFLFARDDRN